MKNNQNNQSNQNNQRCQENQRNEGRKELTQREREVAELLVKGCSNSEMAEVLMVTLSTIKAHIREIMRKLNAKNRVIAAVMLTEAKYVN